MFDPRLASSSDAGHEGSLESFLRVALPGGQVQASCTGVAAEVIDPHFQARVQAFFKACTARNESQLSACFHPEAKGRGTMLKGDSSKDSLASRLLCSLPIAFRASSEVWYQAQEEVAVSWTGEAEARSGDLRPINGIALFQFDLQHRIQDLRLFWDAQDFQAEDSPEAEDPFRATVEAYYRAQNQKDWDGLMEVFADQCSYGGTLAGLRLQGKESIRAVYGSVMSNFPGIQMRPTQDFHIRGEGMVHWEGEALGPDQALRPIRGITYFSLNDRGHITHLRVFWDPRTLMARPS